MKERKYIVVNESGMPMTFDGDQFCYARFRNPVQLYSKNEAHRLIRRTNSYRSKKLNIDISGEKYRLIMVKEEV